MRSDVICLMIREFQEKHEFKTWSWRVTRLRRYAVFHSVYSQIVVQHVKVWNVHLRLVNDYNLAKKYVVVNEILNPHNEVTSLSSFMPQPLKYYFLNECTKDFIQQRKSY